MPAVPQFLPSRSGYHFANAFPNIPLRTIPIPHFGDIPIGDASNGLCGGMVFAVRDLHEAGLTPPPLSTPPTPPSPLFDYIVSRLFESFDIPRGVLRYYEWMQFPDEDNTFLRGAARRTLEEEWPRVRNDIDRGILSPIGLIRVRSLNAFKMGHNHQVLAYGYDVTDAGIAISLYDPNRPDDDGARLTITGPSGKPAITYDGDLPVRGFFRCEYTPGNPQAAQGS